MQDVSLTIAEILRHGGDYHADRRVITATGGGYREITYAQCAQRAAQLAHGLRDIGISGDQRVATLLGNVQEHVEALFAVPCMGSVLHTLNFRLAVDQLAYIAEQADDRVVIVDASLAPTLAKVLPQLTSVHTVVVVGDGDGDCLAGLGKDVIKYEALLAGQSTTFEWPDVDELSAAVMCHTSGTTGNPKGVVYSHRSIYLHSMAASGANSLALAEGEKILQVVPIFHANGWGLPHAAVMAGADLLLPGNGVQASHLIDMITRSSTDGGGRCAHGLERSAGRARPQAAQRYLVAANDSVRRFDRAGTSDADLRRKVRRHHRPVVRHDRNLARRVLGAAGLWSLTRGRVAATVHCRAPGVRGPGQDR